MKNITFITIVLLSTSLYSGILAQSVEQIKTPNSKAGSSWLQLHKSDMSIIVEAGTLNSQVFQKNSMFNSNEDGTSILARIRNNEMMTNSDQWQSMGGFSAGIKIAKTINHQVFDSKVSLDFISGLVYKEANIFQNSYNEYGSSNLIFIECFTIYYARDVKMRSIEIPLELRTNIQLKQWNFSPTLGLGIDLPLNIQEKLYNPLYNDGQVDRGNLISEGKIDMTQHYFFNAISKLEISYALSNNHKIKVSGFYNINITNHLQDQFWATENLSNKGLQIGYEVPLASKSKI